MERLKTHVLVLLTFTVATCSPALGQEQDTPIKIGVLAKRGFEKCLEKWGPTAEYLTTQIPGHFFTIVPLDYEEIDPVAERGEVDFILANPSFYVRLENLHGANRIATLKNRRLDGTFTLYGGVIFHRADRDDIQNLLDLKGKTFMAVKETSFGGWQMAWRELKERGISPHSDFADLRFGGTHDAVVYAVRDGKVDAGTVRTDTFERMALEGKIRLNDFHALEHEHIGEDVSEFPFPHSTRPYPEWPMAKLAHTPNDLAEKVAAALVGMPADCPAAKAARCAGWTVALNYQPVHNCLKELRVGPYKDYGKITFGDVLRRYWPWIASAVVLLTGMAITLTSALRLLRQRKRAEKALSDSEAKFRTLYESTDDAIMLLDKKGFFDCNEATLRLFGFNSREQFCGTHPGKLSPPTQPNGRDSMSYAKDNIAIALKKGHYRLEHLHRRMDGTDFPADVLLNSLELGDRKVLQAVVRDITDRKLAERELQFRSIVLDSIWDGVTATDLDGRITYVNQAELKLIGKSRDQLIGRSVKEVYGEDPAVGSTQQEIIETTRERGAWSGEIVNFTSGEDRIVLDCRTWLLRDDAGQPVGMCGVSRDITDRKQAEAALRESEAKYRTFFDNSVDAMLVIEDRLFVDCNKAAMAMLRYDSKDEVIHRPPAELSPEVQPDGRRSQEKAVEMMNIAADRGSHFFEWDHKRKDGHVFPVEVSLTAIREKNKTMLHTVWRNISDRKRAEEALRKAQESLLAQERHGREMVEIELAKAREKLVNQTRLATIGQVAASIAHELRNPLGAVRNAAYYLKRHVPAENPKLPEYLGIIDQEVSTADTVIRNMMEMARSKEPMRKSVDLGRIVRGVLSRVRLPDTIQCDISLNPDPFVVNADPGQLRQVLNNILVNAIQVMAGTGKIRVEARRNADYDIITVQDSGPGVAAENRERVFEPLYTTKAKGTGLGLTICRQIIERHGGTIELVDHADSGALFRIRLPRQTVQDQPKSV